MLKNICFFLLLLPLCFLYGEEGKIKVNNCVLTKINDQSISVVDVKKRMDMLFHKSYPQYASSANARYQFYLSSWRYVLDDMINTELMVYDSNSKEIKINDGEIREAVEERFGPNIMLTLEKIGISYDEAWKMVKKEIIVKRMSWYFVTSKALSNITPEKIRQAYRDFCAKNPTVEEWQYRIITLALPASTSGDDLIKNVKEMLLSGTEDSKVLELAKTKNGTIQISSDYTLNSKEISEKHKKILTSLKKGEYSEPVVQNDPITAKTSYRLFHLKEYSKKETPPFEELAKNLKDELLQEEASIAAQNYFSRLRKQYGFDEKSLKESLTSSFEPFNIE